MLIIADGTFEFETNEPRGICEDNILKMVMYIPLRQTKMACLNLAS